MINRQEYSDDIKSAVIIEVSQYMLDQDDCNKHYQKHVKS